MLDSLDTLIAFVLIMLVVSLLITIAVQMVASVLNLRGLNLAKGLEGTFAVIAPDVEKNAKELTRIVLKGRFLSDSFLPDWPLLRCWRHSTAVRADEVFDAIHRIAIGRRPAEPDLRENAQTILVALGVDKRSLDDAAAKLKAAHKAAETLGKDASKALEAVKDPNVRAKVQAALDSAAARVSAYETAAAGAAAAAAGSVDAAYEKFQYWIGICQERVEQWFKMHTRIVTVVFAFVFAFWLQLDTVDIFRLVSSNRAVRDKLVAQSAAIGSQAEKALSQSKSVLQKAYAGWLNNSDPNVKAALGSITVEPNDTREKLTSKIDNALASISDKEAKLKSFNDTIDKTATEMLKEQAGDYAAVKADFDNSGLRPVPKE